MDIKNKSVLSEISESLSFNVFETSEVDGKNILARVVGPAFFPDSISDNNVEYTREFWEGILNDPEVKKRLVDRTMFGTIGHEIVHIDNEQLLKGVASHITTKMWIDENNVGMAEHLVLNTDAGRTLNTILRAGSKLRVSTRGLGDTRKRSDGVEEITDYYYQRIDFVILPGFDGALPSVVESLKSKVNESLNNEENSEMSQDNNVAIGVLQQQLDSTKEDLVKTNDEKAQLAQQLEQVKQQLAESQQQIAQYQQVGTVKEVSELKEELAQYQTLGTAQEVSEALDVTSDTMRQLRQQLDNQVVQTAKDVQQTAILEEQLQQVQDKLSKYEKLGTPEEFEQVIDLVHQQTQQTKQVVAESLSAKYSVSKRIVESLVEAHGIHEAEELLAEDHEVADPNRPVTEQIKQNKDQSITEERRRPSNLAGRKRETQAKTLAEALGTANTLAGKLLANGRVRTLNN